MVDGKDTRKLTFLFLIDEHLGHLFAAFGLARRVSRRGHQVVFVVAEPCRELVAEHGFECCAPEWLTASDQPGDKMSLRTTRQSRRAEVVRLARAAREGAAQLVADYRPDLLVFDPFLLMYYPAFWLHGCRAVSISTKPLLTYDPAVPPYTSHLVPDAGHFSRGRIRYAWFAAWARYWGYRWTCWIDEMRSGVSHRSLMLAVAAECRFQLSRERRIRPLSYDLRFRTVPELVLHAIEFEFPRDRELKDGTKYVGPCVDEARVQTFWEPPSGEGPLIYCHLGTVAVQTGSRKLEFLRSIIELFRRQTSWRLLLSVGNPSVEKSLESFTQAASDNVIIAPFVPQLSVLPHCDVAITHGGANSVKECIVAGVPMLVYPHGADQPGNSARVVYHGLGLRGDCRDTGDVIASKVTALLSESKFRDSLKRMAAVFQRYDREGVAERILEEAAGCGNLMQER